jgi:uncharacterized membrane protein
MINIQNVLLFFSVFFSALIAGLLYAYACSVNPGLRALPGAGYLQAMQSINREIQNPYFFLSFIGTLLILPLTAWYAYHHADKSVFFLLLAASLFYLIGVVGITALGNIPLNDGLEKLNISKASFEELAAQRKIFEESWNRFHAIRTGFSMLTLILLIISLLKTN